MSLQLGIVITPEVLAPKPDKPTSLKYHPRADFNPGQATLCRIQACITFEILFWAKQGIMTAFDMNDAKTRDLDARLHTARESHRRSASETTHSDHDRKPHGKVHGEGQLPIGTIRAFLAPLWWEATGGREEEALFAGCRADFPVCCAAWRSA